MFRNHKAKRKNSFTSMIDLCKTDEINYKSFVFKKEKKEDFSMKNLLWKSKVQKKKLS